MEKVLESFLRTTNGKSLLAAIKHGQDLQIEGVSGSFFSFVVAALLKNYEKPILIIVDTPSAAEKMVLDLETFCHWFELKVKPYYFPAMEFLDETGEALSGEIIAERFFILEKLIISLQNQVIVTPVKAMLESVVSPAAFTSDSLKLYKGDILDMEPTMKRLIALDYERVPMVEIRGEFSRRGGIIDIYPLSSEHPVRIELFDNEIESLRLFNIQTQSSYQEIDCITIVPAKEAIQKPQQSNLLDYFPSERLVILSNLNEIKQKASCFEDMNQTDLNWEKLKAVLAKNQKILISDFKFSQDDFLIKTELNLTNKLFDNLAGEACPVGERKEAMLEKIRLLLAKQMNVFIACNNEGEKERLQEIFKEEAIFGKNLKFYIGQVGEGFCFEELKLVVVSDQEIFSRYKIKRSRRILSSGFEMKEVDNIEVGSYVVHVNQGVGKFLGINVDEEGNEQLCIEYAGDSKLYVPLEQISLIDKYIGIKGRSPILNKLGSGAWQKTKARISRTVSEMAVELLDIQAERSLKTRQGFREDTPWQYEFEKAFIYEETTDQLAAIAAIKQDMESSKPMDRLICGDVGFGKTEVALRAVFKAVMDEKQVAILVPTTVLAMQHTKTFKDRLADYPIKVEMLSRFRRHKEQREVIAGLKDGTVDIVIGTHRLIGNDVGFKNLGLLIIDEEQRFGVAHKLKFKAIRRLIDVLTLTATPIPRTLYMSLAGIKDLSVINTPPIDRLPVETIVCEYNEEVIKKAINRELKRDGQVFFVHNRVETIEKVKEALQRLVPNVKIATAHGQMREGELSFIMDLFVAKKIDILVCTTIIESGIDIPNVNTIFINRADMFGLSELYQLKGRVGRYKHRAFAYLLLPRDKVLLNAAKKRLKAIHEYTSLGSGMKVAMKDLEIRGAGNILGQEQHGSIYAIGFELYCKLLKHSIALAKGLPEKRYIDPIIRLPFIVQIPLEYISSLTQRIDIYKRMQRVETKEEVRLLQKEIIDRFGKMNEEIEAVIEKCYLKVLLLEKEISLLEIKNNYLLYVKKGKRASILLPEFFLKIDQRNSYLAKMIKVISSTIP